MSPKVKKRAWSTLSEYVDAILACHDPKDQMRLDAADFNQGLHEVLATVAIMCARRLWGEPNTWTLQNMTQQQWSEFVTQFHCTGWTICCGSPNPLGPCVSCSQNVPGLFLWQDESQDVPLGMNVKKIDVHFVNESTADLTQANGEAQNMPLFLWCLPIMTA